MAGVAALLKAVRPKWSPAAITSAITRTTSSLDNRYHPIRDSFDNLSVSPLAMRSGQINPNEALDPGLIYDLMPEDYVNFLCSMNFNAYEIFAITGSTEYKCQCQCHDDSNSAAGLNYPSFIAFYNAKDNKEMRVVQKFRSRLTNVGKRLWETQGYSDNPRRN